MKESPGQGLGCAKFIEGLAHSLGDLFSLFFLAEPSAVHGEFWGQPVVVLWVLRACFMTRFRPTHFHCGFVATLGVWALEVVRHGYILPAGI